MANVGTDIDISPGADGDQLAAWAPPQQSGVGTIEVGNLDQPHAGPASPGLPARLHWRSLSDGILFCFLTAAPALFAALILRDQRERVWIVFLPIAAAGFLIGGAIAGRHRRLARGAMAQGVTCGLVTATVVVVANAARTAVSGVGFSSRTLMVWLVLELAAVVIAAVGARIGRRLYLRSRRRKAVLT
jgi:hypothetical protein